MEDVAINVSDAAKAAALSTKEFGDALTQLGAVTRKYWDNKVIEAITTGMSGDGETVSDSGTLQTKLTCQRCGGTGERFGNASINGLMCNDCQGTGLVTPQHWHMQHSAAFPTTSTQEAMAAAAQAAQAPKLPHLPIPAPKVIQAGAPAPQPSQTVEINGKQVALDSLPRPMREALLKLVPAKPKPAQLAKPKPGRKLRLE